MQAGVDPTPGQVDLPCATSVWGVVQTSPQPTWFCRWGGLLLPPSSSPSHRCFLKVDHISGIFLGYVSY